MTYNRFMQGLKLAGIELDRRVLAELAVNEPAAFAALVETARAALAANPEATGRRPPESSDPVRLTPSEPSARSRGHAGVRGVDPGGAMPLLTERSARVVAARKLTRRSGRDDAGAFLAEGRQAVREALAEAGDRSPSASCSSPRPPRPRTATCWPAPASRCGWSPSGPPRRCRRRSPRRGWSPSARCATCRPGRCRTPPRLAVAFAG